MDWLRISLTRKLREMLPAPLANVLPYRLVLPLFIGGSDGWVAMVLHESFHALQATVAPAKVAAAEHATSLEADYERHATAMRDAWREELRVLAAGASARSREEAAQQAHRFLARRAARRAAARLPAELVDYERGREWLEGLAKYAELESWRAASVTAGYRPLAAARRDPEFRGYSTFPARWSQELGQMKTASGETRFYYSGMAQARLLDQLMPGWKRRALADGVWLEDLLAESVAAPAPVARAGPRRAP
jgi:hypothetical protein